MPASLLLSPVSHRYSNSIVHLTISQSLEHETAWLGEDGKHTSWLKVSKQQLMQNKNSLFQNKERHKNYELSHSVTPEWIEMKPRGEPQLQTFRYKECHDFHFLLELIRVKKAILWISPSILKCLCAGLWGTAASILKYLGYENAARLGAFMWVVSLQDLREFHGSSINLFT